MKHRNDLTITESRKLCLFWLSFIIILGIAIGAILFSTNNNIKTGNNPWLHQFFSPLNSGNTLFAVFKNSFLSSGLYLTLIFISGFFTFGQPIGLLMLMYRGMGIGISVAHIYSISGISAIPAVLVLILPKVLALSFVAALGVREMLKMSCTQFSFWFKDEQSNEKTKRTAKLYCIKYIVLMIIVFLLSIADSAMNYLFMELY